MISNILNLLFKPKTPDWKKPVELEYKDNILTITTLDRNIKQYYHAINQPTVWAWRHISSRNPIKDLQIIAGLDKAYKHVLTGKKVRNGWVKELH